MDIGTVIIGLGALAVVGFAIARFTRPKPPSFQSVQNQINEAVQRNLAKVSEERPLAHNYREPMTFPSRPVVPTIPQPAKVNRPEVPVTPQSVGRPSSAVPDSLPINYNGNTYYPAAGGGYVTQQGNPVRDALIAGAIGAIVGGLVTSAFSRSPMAAPSIPENNILGRMDSIPSVEKSSAWSQPAPAPTPIQPSTDVDLSNSFSTPNTDVDVGSGSSFTRNDDVDFSDNRSSSRDVDFSESRYESPSSYDSSNYSSSSDSYDSSSSSSSYDSSSSVDLS